MYTTEELLIAEKNFLQNIAKEDIEPFKSWMHTIASHETIKRLTVASMGSLDLFLEYAYIYFQRWDFKTHP